MQNRLIFFFLFLLCVCSLKGQHWGPVSSGITGADANTTWALYADDSVLYAGGYFDTAGGVKANSFAQWNGANWDSVSSHTNGFINAMILYNGNIYVGGQFSAIGGVAASDIARWNGAVWMPVGAGLKDGDYGVNAMVIYNGSLYVSGSFDSSGTQEVHYIARWNDTIWSSVGSPIPAVDEDDGIFTLAVYDGNLYMGGDFAISGGTNFAMWNGTSLTSPGGGTTGYVYSLAVYKNQLYAGGLISQAGAIQANCIAILDAGNWSSPDSGIKGENGWAIVTAMAVYNNELYVGGYFDSVSGAEMNCIAKWNGAHWYSVGSVNLGGSIDAMTVFDSSLYIGGGFDSVGGIYAKNIAMLSITSSINDLNENNTINVYPNPNEGLFYVRLTNAQLSSELVTINVYNVLGETVYNATTNQPDGGQGDYLLNLKTQPDGVYFVSLSDGTKLYNAKVIKE